MRAFVVVTLLSLAFADPFTDYAKKFPNNDGQEGEYNPYLFEGDIIIDGPEDYANLKTIDPLNATPDRNRRWRDNILYYTISDTDFNSEQRGRIMAGIEDLVESTKVGDDYCIRLEERTNERDHVYVRNSGSCSSSIGRRGSRQFLSLTATCVNRHGTVIHEFLHALGFHHEQKRADRDDWVTVNWDNIQPSYRHNFDKLVEGVSVDHLGTTYDYGSCMHYGPYGFAIDRDIPTLIPHDPDAEIGQRIQMSEIDIERVQIFYDCLEPEDSKHFKHLAKKPLPTQEKSKNRGRKITPKSRLVASGQL